jgi:hypothetical protein
MRVRFQDPFLFITGIGFGVLSIFTDELFSPFMFGLCFGGLYLNHKARKNGEL